MITLQEQKSLMSKDVDLFQVFMAIEGIKHYEADPELRKKEVLKYPCDYIVYETKIIFSNQQPYKLGNRNYESYRVYQMKNGLYGVSHCKYKPNLKNMTVKFYVEDLSLYQAIIEANEAIEEVVSRGCFASAKEMSVPLFL
jgi:hypothetical protein